MVVEIVTDARGIGDYGDPVGLQERRRAKPGKLQQLRRIERAAGDNYLGIGAGATFFVAGKILYAGCTSAVERRAFDFFAASGRKPCLAGT